eukprot:4401820-Prymnesium_polylepis.1
MLVEIKVRRHRARAATCKRHLRQAQCVLAHRHPHTHPETGAQVTKRTACPEQRIVACAVAQRHEASLVQR